MRLVFLRVLLAWAAIPPLGFGLAAALDASYVLLIIQTFSNAVASPTPELNYLLKPLGLYLMAFGAMLLLPVFDPERYRGLITLGAAVLSLRGVQRLSLTGELERLFQIRPETNVVHCVYLFVIAGGMLWLRPRRPSQ